MLVKLIVPVDLASHKIKVYHRTLRETLCAHWGGFTASDATGGWNNAAGQTVTEPVFVYHIAVPEDLPSVREDFRKLAREIKADLAQDCVYLEFNPAATVELV